MELQPDLLRAALAAPHRFALAAALMDGIAARRVAEIGVFEGAFAARTLAALPAIETYWLIDPWRNLPGWNKPANRPDAEFEAIMTRALAATAPFEGRTRVLRGRTVEVIDAIPDGSLDAVYVDGDHTLRGFSVDCMLVWPKLRDGGLMLGDDFTPSMWQHGEAFEPSAVFPFAVHFAEAAGSPIYALPFNQFAMVKDAGRRAFAFRDLVGAYPDIGLLAQVGPRAPAPPG